MLTMSKSFVGEFWQLAESLVFVVSESEHSTSPSTFLMVSASACAFFVYGCTCTCFTSSGRQVHLLEHTGACPSVLYPSFPVRRSSMNLRHSPPLLAPFTLSFGPLTPLLPRLDPGNLLQSVLSSVFGALCFYLASWTCLPLQTCLHLETQTIYYPRVILEGPEMFNMTSATANGSPRSNRKTTLTALTLGPADPGKLVLKSGSSVTENALNAPSY